MASSDVYKIIADIQKLTDEEFYDLAERFKDEATYRVARQGGE